MSDSLERALYELRFDVPVGLVERAKKGASTETEPQATTGEDGPESRRRVSFDRPETSGWSSKPQFQTPRAMALVAALLAIAIVATLVVGARALHLAPGVPANRGLHLPLANTEVCRTQCEVATQPTPWLVPKPPTALQCPSANDCQFQAGFFATANLGWMTKSFGSNGGGPALLFRTDDGGQHWSPLLGWDGPGAQQIRSSADGREALVVTGWDPLATIFYTADGGAHWTAHGLPFGSIGGPRSHWLVDFVNEREGWVVSPNLEIIHTTDSGGHWTRIARLDTGTSWLNLYQNETGFGFLDSTLGWYVPANPNQSHASYFYLTHDGGTTWDGQVLPKPGGVAGSYLAVAAAVKFFDRQHGAIDVVLWNGHTSWSSSDPRFFDYVYLTSDGGGHWSSPMRLPGARTIFIDANHWFALTGDMMFVESVIRTADAGQHWSVLIAPGNRDVNNWDVLGSMIGFIDPSIGWAVTPTYQVDVTTVDRALLFTSDGGVSWTVRPLPA